jgi:hypothetical protein
MDDKGGQLGVVEVQVEQWPACGHERATLEVPCPYPDCKSGTPRKHITVKMVANGKTHAVQLRRLVRKRGAQVHFIWGPR